MELKEFVVETISAIVDATSELQDKYKDALINPPTAKTAPNVYKEGNENYVYRHVKNVEFDVALTVGKEAEGKGKAGIKIFSAEASAGGTVSKTSEQVSRVQFSIPLALSPTDSEEKNMEVREKAIATRKENLKIPRRKTVSRGIV